MKSVNEKNKRIYENKNNLVTGKNKSEREKIHHTN